MCTDLAVFHIVDGELRLTECAPGVTPAAVRERTGAPCVEDFHPEGLRHVSTIDVSSLTAFDVHTHVHRSVRADQPPDPGGREDMGEYFRIGTMPRYTVPELADYYRQRNMACVTFTVDSISQTGHEPVPDNFEVAELAAEHADVLILFASIDPARGAAGVAQARRLIADFGVRGFKFHPGTQAFYPNDRMAYPLYEVIAEHGLVALFHTGQTGVGAGTRGGGGDPAEVLQPAVPRRRGRRLPGHGHHHGPSIISLAGRGTVDRHPQAAGLHRPVRLVAEASACAVRGQPAAGQGAVRHRFPGYDARAMDQRLREPEHQARGPAADHEGERGPAVRAEACGAERA